jgi:cell pole-organizing protein PopZ
MEEILASIRRIIEDSDSVRKPLDEAELPPQLSAAPSPAAMREVPATVPEARIAGVEQVRAPESEPADAGRIEEPENEVRVFQAELRDTTSALDAAWQTEPAVDAPAIDADAAEAVEADEIHTTRNHFGENHAGENRSGENRPDEGRPMLMSDHAGRQVAAAFGELSEAFAASRRRSFDEMAEEMLRPMLQDWLDNNLPTLVERLVREEIERVARGG